VEKYNKKGKLLPKWQQKMEAVLVASLGAIREIMVRSLA
jgi:hypothetical protein